MNLGTSTINIISDGIYHVDGGGVFGQIPKVKWEQWIKPDRRNRVKLDCWILIQISTFCETSRHNGVSWHKVRSNWQAAIRHDGKKRSLGNFTNEDEAALAHTLQYKTSIS